MAPNAPARHSSELHILVPAYMMCAFGVPGNMIHGPVELGLAEIPVVSGVAKGIYVTKRELPPLALAVTAAAALVRQDSERIETRLYQSRGVGSAAGVAHWRMEGSNHLKLDQQAQVYSGTLRTGFV